MKKKFDIIPIEDYGVVVDKIEVKHKDLFLFEGRLYDVKDDGIHLKSRERGGRGWEYLRTANMMKVIATVNKRIDDIPLIWLHDWEEPLRKSGLAFGVEKAAFVKGWNAANKGYSEEDMRNCWNHPKVKTSGWGLADVKFEEFIKSLQPKLPKSVVLEMEDYDSPTVETNDKGHILKISSDKRYVIKITNPSTNTIIPISYE